LCGGTLLERPTLEPQISEIIGFSESVCHPCQSEAYLCRVAEPNLVHEEPGDERKEVRVMDYAAERNARFLGGLLILGFAL
jgi:hypothetical protein